MTTITDEYATQIDKYRNQYGKYTIVLLQVGNFYEVYADRHDEEQIKVCRDILRLSVEEKNDKIAFVGMTKSKSGFCLNLFNNRSLTEPPTKALPGGKSSMDIGQSFGFKSPKRSFDSNVSLLIKMIPKLF